MRFSFLRRQIIEKYDFCLWMVIEAILALSLCGNAMRTTSNLVNLISHSSLILQPLDLACFSPLKSRYCKHLIELAKFDDAAIIKKSHFLQHYNNARNEGLSCLNIRAGWSLETLERSFDPLKLFTNASQEPRAPKTPPKRKRKASPNVHIITPENRR